MFAKFLLYGALLGLAAADVKHLSREYLPPISEALTKTAGEVPSLLQQDELVGYQEKPFVQQDEIVGNEIELNGVSASTKQGNNPYGYNGFPGAFPNFPGGSQGFPGQGFPGQGFPGQGFPGQGFPGQGFPVQGFPGQEYPGLGFPGQGFPSSPGFINNGFPGQGFPGQGFPGQGFPGQGFPGQGFPGQGFPGQGFPGQGFPNYPIYHSSEQLKQKPTPQPQDEKSSLRVASDTLYDNTGNGGYLYNKPSKTF